MEDLDAATLDDVKEWFQTYYGPANAVLVVAGDIDADDARRPRSSSTSATSRRARRSRGRRPGSPSGPAASAAGHAGPRAAGPALQGVERARVGIGRRRLPGPRRVTCSSTGKSSRLYKRLVYDEQIATDVDASVDLREIGGLLHRSRPPSARASTRPRVERAIDEELARFLAAGPTAVELERAKTQHARRVHPRRRAHRRVRRQVRRAGAGRGLRGTAGLLQDAARADRRRHRGAGPRRRGALALRRRVHPRGRALPRVRRGADRGRPVRAAAARHAAGRGVPRARARHALQRAQDRPGRAPRRFRWCSSTCCSTPASPPTSSPQPGTASLAMSMLDEGTATRTSLQISDAPRRPRRHPGHRLPARRRPASRSRRCASKLDPSLALYADVILHPAFPRADFERLRKQRLVQIQREKADPIGMALRVLPRVLYGDGHAYANPLDRLGHRGVGREDHPRGPGRVPPDLVQAQPRHARGRRRHHDGRAQAEARAAVRRLAAGRGAAEEHRRRDAGGAAAASTCSTGRGRSSR